MKASTSFSRLTSFLRRASELVSLQLDAQLLALFAEVDRRQDRAQRLGADRRVKLVFAVIILGLQIFFLAQQLVLL